MKVTLSQTTIKILTIEHLGLAIKNKLEIIEK